MIPIQKPYFMRNKDWYYHDKEEWLYKLTNKATLKAIESYENFYKMLRGKKND